MQAVCAYVANKFVIVNMGSMAHRRVVPFLSPRSSKGRGRDTTMGVARSSRRKASGHTISPGPVKTLPGSS